MSNLYNDKMLLADTTVYLTELHNAGMYDVEEMSRHLQTVFFTEEWETFLVLQNWVATVQLKKEKEGTQ